MRNVFFIILSICFVSCTYHQNNENPIDAKLVSYIEINIFQTKNDTLFIYPRKLSQADKNMFINKWNKTIAIRKPNSRPKYSIHVNFKDCKQRSFYINSEGVTENWKNYFNFGDDQFFNKLWENNLPQYPKCHFDKIIPISYGLPIGEARFMKRVRQGEIYLGGCELDSLGWHCNIHNINF